MIDTILDIDIEELDIIISIISVTFTLQVCDELKGQWK